MNTNDKKSEPDFTKKVGSVTYLVHIYPSEHAKDTVEDKLKRVILQELAS